MALDQRERQKIEKPDNQVDDYFNHLYQFLDVESGLDLYKALDELKGHYSFFDKKEIKKCLMQISGILARGVPLLPIETGETTDEVKFANTLKLASLPELELLSQMDEASKLLPLLDFLEEEVGLMDDSILSGHWQARSSLASERYVASQQYQNKSHQDNTIMRHPTPFLDFDSFTGELFVWREVFPGSGTLTDRFVTQENTDTGSLESLHCVYDVIHQPDDSEPLPLSLTTYRLLERPGYKVKKKIQHTFKTQSKNKNSTPSKDRSHYEINIHFSDGSGGETLRHYEFFIQYAGNQIERSFELESLGPAQTQKPLENTSIKENNFSVSLLQEKRRQGHNTEKPFFKLELDHLK